MELVSAKVCSPPFCQKFLAEQEGRYVIPASKKEPVALIFVTFIGFHVLSAGENDGDSAGSFDCLYVCLGYELTVVHISAGYDADDWFHENPPYY